MRKKILYALEKIGIAIDDNEKNSDFDLSEFFLDSIQFISFIVEMEEVIGIQLPDDFLLLEKYCSFNALCDVLSDITEKEILKKGGTVK